MGWIRYVRCEKLQHDFVAQTFVLTAPVQYVLHQVSCSYEMIPNAPKCVRCEKSRRDFAAPTFTLIAPVHPVFHRVSCSYETIPNAPIHYETYQNMSLRSNVVDQVRLLQKITT